MPGRIALAALAALLAGQAQEVDAEPLAVPSGQEIALIDMIGDAPGPVGPTLRFRFLAPGIAREGGTVTPETAFGDMQFLCETYALPRIAAAETPPAQVVISLSDRVVPFGESDPEATQFFEAFRPEGDACIWEAF